MVTDQTGINQKTYLYNLDMFANTYQVRGMNGLVTLLYWACTVGFAFSISLLRKQQTALSFMTSLDL